MNIKAKSALIIVVTMVIGIVIGALFNRALLQHRIKRAFAMRSPVFMMRITEDIIQPNSEQTKLIREVLKRHAERISYLREESRKEMQAAMKELWNEMDSILTPEQKKRLEESLPRPFRRMRMLPDRRRPLRGKPRNIPPREEDKEYPF